MPNTVETPVESQVPEEKPFDLSNMSFDDLYNFTQSPTTVQTTEQQLPAEPAPQVQPPAPAEPFLRTPTGSVYETKEAAERGYAEKDRVIEQLRQLYISEKGFDPVTGRKVEQPAAEEINYTLDQERYYNDIAEANTERDARKFFQVQAKLMYDLFSPYLPVLSQAAKNIALDSVSEEAKDFKEFTASNTFKDYLESRPLLKQAIEVAERDPRGAGQLRELYFLAYEGARGHSLPEILRSHATARVTPTVAPSSTPTNPRTTTTMVPTSNPPADSASPMDISTPEGRKAIIEEGKRRGTIGMVSQILDAGRG